jgi:hypothetical protein
MTSEEGSYVDEVCSMEFEISFVLDGISVLNRTRRIYLKFSLEFHLESPSFSKLQTPL